MFDLEESIKLWRKSLRRNQALEDSYVEELESHLREKIDDFVNKGLNEETSFYMAEKEIGKTESIGEEYYKTDTKHRIPHQPWKANLWTPMLLYNYLKIVLRNIRHSKSGTFINVSGLAVGFASFILIFLWVQDEISYDRFHEKADRIYRLCSHIIIGNTDLNQTQTPALLPTVLKSDYPEVEQTVRLGFPITATATYQNKAFVENNILPADSTFFDVFSFKLIKGNTKTALAKPGSIVITDETAQKYFGNEDPIGKVIILNGQFELSITGVVENIPRNSHFHFDIPLSMITINDFINKSWNSNDFRTYIVLRDGFSSDDLEAKFPELIVKYVGKGKSDWLKEGNSYEYYLQPLTEIHLKSDISSEFEPNGNETYVYVFSIIAAFVLLIACINYMNLTTARSTARTKEIGLRKVVGSTRSQIIIRFLYEAVIFSLIALSIGILIVALTLPVFNNFVNKELHINIFSNLNTLIYLLFLAVIIGLISGSYPSFYLSLFKPISVIRGNLREGIKSARFRNFLVVFQFSISIVLFIGTVIIIKQVEYFNDKNLGFDKDNVIVIKNVQVMGDQKKAFKEALLKYAGINSVSGSYSLPGEHFVNYGFKPEDSETVLLNFGICDPVFIETLSLKMEQGRFFPVSSPRIPQQLL